MMVGMRIRLTQARQGLTLWTRRQWTAAAVSAVAVGLLLGVATVLIPNPVFGREIAPVWWNYPVLVVTAALSGMLTATYVRPERGAPAGPDEKLSAWGTIGAIGSWFAIGCPVCNKIALLALGYTGALTWFGPFQPWLAAISLVLLTIGLVFRLSGTVACSVPRSRKATVAA